MFDFIKNGAANIALYKFKEGVVNPNLKGIGVVKAISYENKMLHLTVVLDGLEDREITVTCKDISIAEDASSVTVKSFTSNMPFAENALNSFVAGKSFDIPEGARSKASMAKTVLGL